jgi:internalin A
VLTFTKLSQSGDVFTREVFSGASSIEISFDYLGLAKPGSVAGDLGGFFGVSSGLPGWNNFFAGTQDTYSSVTTPLIDDGAWHRVSYLLRRESIAAFHLAIEDFLDSKGIAGDVYFDNIKVKAVAGTDAAAVPSALTRLPGVPAAPVAVDWRTTLQRADDAYAENRFDEAIKLYDAGLAGMEQDQTTDATILKTEKAAALKQRGLASFIPQRDKLPADKQVEATQTKLRELNPGYNGKGRFVIQERRIVEAYLNDVDIADLSPLKGLPLVILECVKNKVSDLAPLRGMPLEKLICWENQVSDISALAGMELTKLDITRNSVADLSPLKGMLLVEFHCAVNRVTDLNPLRGMPLQILHAFDNAIKDISPLKGMPLTELHLGGNRVVDLTALRECPLKMLMLVGNPVRDLSPVKGLPLEFIECPSQELSDLSPLAGMRIQHLYCISSNVIDLSPLKGMPLRKLIIKAQYIKTGWEAIRQIPTLKEIEQDGDGAGRQTAAEFWKRFDAGEFSKPVPK